MRKNIMFVVLVILLNSLPSFAGVHKVTPKIYKIYYLIPDLESFEPTTYKNIESKAAYVFEIESNKISTLFKEQFKDFSGYIDEKSEVRIKIVDPELNRSIFVSEHLGKCEYFLTSDDGAKINSDLIVQQVGKELFNRARTEKNMKGIKYDFKSNRCFKTFKRNG